MDGRNTLPLLWQDMRVPPYFLIKLLRSEGYDFQYDQENYSRESDMAFRRNSDHLELPIEYTGETEEDRVYAGFRRMIYRWNGHVPSAVARSLKKFTELNQF